jgi:hypothetical protein
MGRMDMSKRLSKTPEDVEPDIEDVISRLATGGFTYRMGQDATYGLQKAVPTILVELQNVEELLKLTSALEGAEGISGEVIETKYESIAAQQDKVYENLFKKAQSSAGRLAKVSGSNLGSLISVTDIIPVYTTESANYVDMMNQMLKMMPFQLVADCTDITVKREVVRMVFKFEIK